MKNSKGYEENLHGGRRIRTVSGIYVDVFDPKPDMFCIEDIAHALSMMPRFGGHLPHWYSVADHCNNCVAIAEGQHYDILMHDCAEAYLIDLPKPIKKEIDRYNELEDNLMKVLSDVFDFNYPFSSYVHEVDTKMLETEWRMMLGHYSIAGMESTPARSKAEFLRNYDKLKPRLR